MQLPPLRERREDIPLLAAHFLKESAPSTARRSGGIAEPVRQAIAAYDWPGNVRELRNLIESMVVLDTDGVLGLDDVQEDEPLQTGRRRAAARRRGPTAWSAGRWRRWSGTTSSRRWS